MTATEEISLYGSENLNPYNVLSECALVFPDVVLFMLNQSDLSPGFVDKTAHSFSHVKKNCTYKYYIILYNI